MHSKILSQKTTYKAKFFHIDQVTYERNSTAITKDVIIRNQIVQILPLTPENELYLIREFRDVYQKFLLETIGGHMDKDELPLEAAKRELKEETGLSAKNWSKLMTMNLSSNIESVYHIFLATDLIEGEAKLDSDEDIQLIKIPLSQAVEKVVNGEITLATNISVILLLDKLQKEGKI